MYRWRGGATHESQANVQTPGPQTPPPVSVHFFKTLVLKIIPGTSYTRKYDAHQHETFILSHDRYIIRSSIFLFPAVAFLFFVFGTYIFFLFPSFPLLQYIWLSGLPMMSFSYPVRRHVTALWNLLPAFAMCSYNICLFARNSSWPQTSHVSYPVRVAAQGVGCAGYRRVERAV